ncbi:MAG: hypothetical protein EOP10_14390 [Proteobacteria bacterium]|nr:MAG: hypothetical protein EOP10_14390 [Pseudomonadota bacterium]
MLQNIDPTMRNPNILLSPTEFNELNAGIEGKIVGVSMEVWFTELLSCAEVHGFIARTPAAKAKFLQAIRSCGLMTRVIKVSSLGCNLCNPRQGKFGCNLTLLHNEQIKKIKLKREALVWDTVNTRMLPNEVDLFTIRNLIEATPKA